MKTPLIRKVRSSKKGFSLVGVLIAAGIMGMLALTLAQLMNDSVKSKVYLTTAVDFENLKANIQRVILHPTQCDTAWKRVDGTDARFENTPNPANIPQRIQIGSEVIAQVGLPISPGLILESMEFTTPGPATAGPGPDQTTRPVSLILRARRNQGVSIGGGLISNSNAPITFSFITNNLTNDEIVDCLNTTSGGGGGITTAAACNSIVGATWNGTQCVLASTPNQVMCETNLGGYWTPPSGPCTFGGSGTVTAQTMCGNMGGQWDPSIPPAGQCNFCTQMGMHMDTGTTPPTCVPDRFKLSDGMSTTSSSGLPAPGPPFTELSGFKPNQNHLVTVVVETIGTPSIGPGTNLVTINTSDQMLSPTGSTAAGKTIILEKRISSSSLTTTTPATARYRITSKDTNIKILNFSVTSITH
jgi:Tfp pilus assembly major pilin PilA